MSKSCYLSIYPSLFSNRAKQIVENGQVHIVVVERITDKARDILLDAGITLYVVPHEEIGIVSAIVARQKRESKEKEPVEHE